jgi:hypothetical protein
MRSASFMLLADAVLVQLDMNTYILLLLDDVHCLM